MFGRSVLRVWFTILLLVLLGTNLFLSRQKTLVPSDCIITLGRDASRNYDGIVNGHGLQGEEREAQRSFISSANSTGVSNSAHTSLIEWSNVAYMQYATDVPHLCNSIMIFESLHRLRSRADRLLLYPSDFSVQSNTIAGNLLRKARDEYGVKLMPVQLQIRPGADYSDATVLQPMDELLLLPSVPVAMPRAYWLDPDKRILGSHVLLVEPSAAEFRRVMKAIEKAKNNEYDMEILNNLYRDSAMVLPHKQYGLLTGEFRSNIHFAFLGNKDEEFDPEVVIKRAKYMKRLKNINRSASTTTSRAQETVALESFGIHFIKTLPRGRRFVRDSDALE
ncbi:N-acetylglucosaminyltransferase [Ascosphaera aggregata]|nr:N-acetylglucosaminyltransferase [Ascosphaera aggregata]